MGTAGGWACVGFILPVVAVGVSCVGMAVGAGGLGKWGGQPHVAKGHQVCAGVGGGLCVSGATLWVVRQ